MATAIASSHFIYSQIDGRAQSAWVLHNMVYLPGLWRRWKLNPGFNPDWYPPPCPTNCCPSQCWADL